MPAAIDLGRSTSSGGYLEDAEAFRLQRPNVSSRAPLPLIIYTYMILAGRDVSSKLCVRPRSVG